MGLSQAQICSSGWWPRSNRGRQNNGIPVNIATDAHRRMYTYFCRERSVRTHTYACAHTHTR